MGSDPGEMVDKAERLYRAGKYQAAADAYAAAASVWEGVGERVRAAEMRGNQSVALIQADDYQRAYEAVQGTDLIFKERGDIQRQGIALSNQAAALGGLERWEGAAEKYRRAGELFEEVGEREKYRQVMKALSALHLRARQPMAAMAAMLAGLESEEQPSVLQRALKRVLKVPFKLLNR